MLLLSHWLIHSVTHPVNCWFISTVINPFSQFFSHTFLEFNALSFIDSLTNLFTLITHLIIQWLNHSVIYISVLSCILLFIQVSPFITCSFAHRFSYTIMDASCIIIKIIVIKICIWCICTMIYQILIPLFN